MTRIAIYDEMGTLASVPGPTQAWVTTLGRTSHLARLLNMVWLQLLWTWEYREEERGAPVSAFIEENPDLTALTNRYLHQLATEVRQSGAQFVLMAVPSRERTVNPELRTGNLSFPDKVREWADDNSISYVDLTPTFYLATDDNTQVFLERDIHFTGEGHELVADILIEACPKLFSRASEAEKCVTR